MLSARNLIKRYGGKEVVSDISLSIERGEVVGFLGPNGAGKTTTVGMLYGLVVPDAGTVSVASIDLFRSPRAAKRFLGVVPQDDNLDPDFTTEENLIRFATYYGLSMSAGRERADELLAQVGLSEHREKRIDELSGGMKRRLMLARALIHNPQILFLDEPTTGLDPDARQDFWRLVFELRDRGAAILLTTHYMEEAARLCSRVLLIQAGKILDENAPEALVEKYVGRSVLEIQGLDLPQLEEAKERFGLWVRPYSGGFLIPLPEEKRSEILSFLESYSPKSLQERRGNLEDVFLGLTGEKLG